MIKLDDNLLQELGLGVLPPEEKKKMLAHIYETLEMRVGMALAKQMNDGQLSEFEQFINRNDEAGALQWLESNFPNYRDVVAAEFETLKGEIKQSAPQIVATSQQQAAQLGQPAAYPADLQGNPYPPEQGQYPQQPQSGQYAPQPGQPYPQQPPQGYPQPMQPQYQQQMPPAGQQPYYPPQQSQQPPQPGQQQSYPGQPQGPETPPAGY